jgi:ribosomal protein S21
VLYYGDFFEDYGSTSLSFVTLREGEDGEQLLKRFQTSMQRSGILRELRNRRFFRSKGEQTRLDKARSLRRIRRRQRQRRQ